MEDSLDKYGLEKAIHLSLVWANITFLGCSYPSHTHQLVADYPLPDQKLLLAERRKREGTERKRRGSGGEGNTEVDSKRARLENSDLGHNSSADDTDLPFEDISQSLDALISTIRKQHEKKLENISQQQEQGTNADRKIPKALSKMLHTMCMCEQCFCAGNSPSSLVNSIIQRYVARFDKMFLYEFLFNEKSGITRCRFLINNQLVAEGSDENRKTAKQKAAEQFLQLINGYYQDEGKPCCPH